MKYPIYVSFWLSIPQDLSVSTHRYAFTWKYLCISKGSPSIPTIFSFNFVRRRTLRGLVLPLEAFSTIPRRHMSFHFSFQQDPSTPLRNFGTHEHIFNLLFCFFHAKVFIYFRLFISILFFHPHSYDLTFSTFLKVSLVMNWKPLKNSLVT